MTLYNFVRYTIDDVYTGICNKKKIDFFSPYVCFVLFRFIDNRAIENQVHFNFFFFDFFFYFKWDDDTYELVIWMSFNLNRSFIIITLDGLDRISLKMLSECHTYLQPTSSSLEKKKTKNSLSMHLNIPE